MRSLFRIASISCLDLEACAGFAGRWHGAVHRFWGGKQVRLGEGRSASGFQTLLVFIIYTAYPDTLRTPKGQERRFGGPIALGPLLSNTQISGSSQNGTRRWGERVPGLSSRIDRRLI